MNRREHPGRFQVHCSTCRQRRSVIPALRSAIVARNGILLCPGRCDGVPFTEAMEVLPSLTEMTP